MNTEFEQTLKINRIQYKRIFFNKIIKINRRKKDFLNFSFDRIFIADKKNTLKYNVNIKGRNVFQRHKSKIRILRQPCHNQILYYEPKNNMHF